MSTSSTAAERLNLLIPSLTSNSSTPTIAPTTTPTLMAPRFPTLSPPLLNSSCRWATTHHELHTLYHIPTTGAVTTRTTQLAPFPDDPSIHQHTFVSETSINTYGYSPHTLEYYLRSIASIVAPDKANAIPQRKPFIVSIGVEPLRELAEMIDDITAFAFGHELDLAIEINLGCPNLPSSPAPAGPPKTKADHEDEEEESEAEKHLHKRFSFTPESLAELFATIPASPGLPIGLKLPPFTIPSQFSVFLDALADSGRGKISFLTSTNTLSPALPMVSPPALTVPPTKHYIPTLSSADGTGCGGMAGEAIHFLSLGNVNCLRRGLDERGLKEVVIIGVGGVRDGEGMERMMAAGAAAVGVATALGKNGEDVFARILGREEGDRKVVVGGIEVTEPPN